MITSADARYAIYFVPAAQMSLYQFGRSILGYDCYTGKDVGLLDGLDQEFANWLETTDEPRRYRFHATLKAPFRFPPSCSEAALTDAFDKIRHAPVLIVRHVFEGVLHTIDLVHRADPTTILVAEQTTELARE